MGTSQDSNAKVLRYTSLGLYFIGVLLVGFGVYFYFLASAAESWPSVQGMVEKATVRMSVSRVGDAVHRSYEYYPAISYSYEVAGIPYSGDRYQLGTTMEKFSEKSDALKLARKFQVGSEVPVFYDPDDPSSAVLEPSFTFAVFVPGLLGLLFLGTAWGLSKALKAQRRQEPCPA